MKKYYSIVFFLLLGCNTQKIHTIYKSSCRLYDKNEIELLINSNTEFTYKFAYLDYDIKGNWKKNADTLILYSDKFTEKQEDFTPKIKNTDFIGLDKYLIKNGKLFAINKNGVSQSCFLKSINK